MCSGGEWVFFVNHQCSKLTFLLSAGAVGVKIFFVPIHSVRHTLAHVLIHQRKIDTDLQTKLQKPPSCIPQWISIVSSRTQTFNLKENAQHSFTCSFLKRLRVAILRLFQCFYYFLVLYQKNYVFLREWYVYSSRGPVGMKTFRCQIFFLVLDEWTTVKFEHWLS